MPKKHPLEPLSAPEIAEAVRLLKANPVFTAKTRIISIMLREPPKSAVYDWPNTDTAEAVHAPLFRVIPRRGSRRERLASSGATSSTGQSTNAGCAPH
jgi:primary-amine oxidase